MTFRAEITASLHTCLTAWPTIHTECDAAAFGPGRTGGNGSSGADISDPTGRAAENGVVSKSAGAFAWMGEWGDWLLTLRLWDHTTATSDRTVSWTPGAVTVWAAPAVKRLADVVENAGGWHARQSIELVLCVRLLRLSNKASGYAPRVPRRGELIGGVTIGERTNTVERCAECDQTVLGTSEDPIRRIDGQPFHAKSCYYRAWRRRQQAQQGKAS